MCRKCGNAQPVGLAGIGSLRSAPRNPSSTLGELPCPLKSLFLCCAGLDLR